jgi:hypothetical protein
MVPLLLPAVIWDFAAVESKVDEQAAHPISEYRPLSHAAQLSAEPEYPLLHLHSSPTRVSVSVSHVMSSQSSWSEFAFLPVPHVSHLIAAASEYSLSPLHGSWETGFPSASCLPFGVADGAGQ